MSKVEVSLETLKGAFFFREAVQSSVNIVDLISQYNWGRIALIAEETLAVLGEDDEEVESLESLLPVLHTLELARVSLEELQPDESN